MTDKPRYTKKSISFLLQKYYGEFTPSNLVFNANLQEFEQQVSFFCNLTANGEMAPEDAYKEIKKFWQKLEHSKKELLDKAKLMKSEEDLLSNDGASLTTD
ncbi:MAG: hypothetical protein QNJ55_23690 [Xenococcus sp. MO_188.B8]|nr:hypothetical protein [Xenococcus sp. MO_188.B8]